MSQVNKEDLAIHSEVSREVAMTEYFWTNFKKSKEAGNKFEQALDSLMVGAGQASMPASLQKIFAHPAMQSKEAREAVLDGLEFGVKAYQGSNGGDMPDHTLMAAALCEAASMLGDTQFQSALDSLTNAHHEQLSVVPEMVQVTISTRLSTGLPFFSQLPNPKGSNELPFLIANIVAGSDFAGMQKGDRLDGAKAGSSFVFNKRMGNHISRSTQQCTEFLDQCVGAGLLVPSEELDGLPYQLSITPHAGREFDASDVIFNRRCETAARASYLTTTVER